MVFTPRHSPSDNKATGTGTGAPLTPIWQRAQALAAGLPAYSMRAHRRMIATNRGVHGRRRAGAGDSFWQYRPYEQGEEASAIDWRRSARSDALYVRQQEWETAQNIWFWIDTSKSMRFRSENTGDSKLDRARLLALGAACLLTGAGEKVALYGVHDRAAGGHFGMNRLLDAMALTDDMQMVSFPDPAGLSGRMRLVIIGDFLEKESRIRDRLHQLVSLGVDAHLLHILDPVEEDFPYRGFVRFEGLEAENHIMLNRAEDMAAFYRARMAAWIKTIGDMARRAGWTHSLHRTDHSPALALLSLMALTGQDR